MEWAYLIFEAEEGFKFLNGWHPKEVANCSSLVLHYTDLFKQISRDMGLDYVAGCFSGTREELMEFLIESSEQFRK